MTADDRELPVEPLDSGEGSRSSHARAGGDAGLPARGAEKDSPKTGKSGRPGKKHMPIWQETLLLLGVALVLAIAIKALFVQAFYIPSESMEPGLVENDRILVQKVSYWFDGEPERGDVVVFKDPGGWLSAIEAAGPQNALTEVMARIGLYPSGGHLVKRVIGVEGDVIECCDAEGRLMVNGEPLHEDDYARPDADGCYGPMPRGDCTWTAGPIPEDSIFVMGDNRARSADSSQHMCPPRATECVPGDEFIDTDLVVGKVFVLLWPREHFGWVSRPDTFADVPDEARVAGSAGRP